MRAIAKWLTAFGIWLCGIFGVSPDWLVKDKRGNLPPPSGGPGSF
jgi:hypothetical protein